MHFKKYLGMKLQELKTNGSRSEILSGHYSSAPLRVRFFSRLARDFAGRECTEKKAQSVIEYTLLVSLLIVGLVMATCYTKPTDRHNPFENYFKQFSYFVGGVNPN